MSCRFYVVWNGESRSVLSFSDMMGRDVSWMYVDSSVVPGVEVEVEPVGG